MTMALFLRSSYTLIVRLEISSSSTCDCEQARGVGLLKSAFVCSELYWLFELLKFILTNLDSDFSLFNTFSYS